MSCPDWRDLCARREADSGDVPGWHAALEHMDECPSCREAAVEADPALLFRSLPSLEADSSEIQEMQRAVASMRRSDKLARNRWSVPTSWLRAAALGAVLIGSILLRGAGAPPEDLALAGSPVAEAPAEVTRVAEEAESSESNTVRALPLVEMVDPSYGPIIQVVDQDISLVVVMPENQDV